MANHGFITAKRAIKPETMAEDIHRICDEFFPGGQVQVEGPTGPTGYTTITFLDTDAWQYLQFWKASPRMIEHRHSTGDFYWWVESVISHELARRYDGVLSDEGVSDRWEPKPKNEWPTFADYYHTLHDWVRPDDVKLKKFLFKRIWRDQCRLVPPSFKPFIGKL